MAQFQINIGNSNYQVEAEDESHLPEIADTLYQENHQEIDRGRISPKDAIPQIVKGVYSNLPWAKVAIQKMAPDLAQVAEDIPSPQGGRATAARVLTEGAMYTPAFMSGEGLVAGGARAALKEGVSQGISKGVAKELAKKVATQELLGGSLGVGAQTAGLDLTEGKGLRQSAFEGAETAGTTLVGGKIIGKAIEGIAGIPQAAEWTSRRIYNSIIAPLKRDFVYAKNPGRGLAETKLTFNNWDEAPAKVQQELTTRTADLEQSVANRTETIDPSRNIDAVFAKAKADATRQNNKTLLNGINEVEKAVKNNLTTDADGNIVVSSAKKLSNITLKEALQLKRNIGEITTWTGNPTDLKPLNSLKQRLYRIVKNKMNEAAPELADKNEVIADLIGAKNAIIHRSAIEMRQSLLGMPSRIAGVISGVGYMATHNPATVIPAIAMIGVEKALKSPFIMTRLAGTFARIGEADASVVLRAFPALSGAMKNIGAYIQKLGPAKQKILAEYPELAAQVGKSGVDIAPEEVAEVAAPKAQESSKANWIRADDGTWSYREPQGESFLKDAWKDLKKNQGKADLKTTVAVAGSGLVIATASEAASKKKADKYGYISERLPSSKSFMKKGEEFNSTASTYGWGEKLNSTRADNEKMNAEENFVAMRGIPLNSEVEITDLKTGKIINSSVKDFGPHKRLDRKIDLSKGAFKKLGYKKAGLARVRVKVLRLGNGDVFAQHKEVKEKKR